MSERHSSEYLGPWRESLWNADFLALMAQRWDLKTVQSVLEVGSGAGHWSRALATVLPPEASLVGVDREDDWVNVATRRAQEAGLDEKLRYFEGDGETLPFLDDSMDMVTCQTVLMHVQSAPQVLNEMLRVLRPGGLLVLVEPNNLIQGLVMDNLKANDDVPTLVEAIAFQLTCERGKAARGEGDNSIGDRLPALLNSAGLDDIQVYSSDKTFAVHPPYTKPEQRAYVDALLDWADRDIWAWPREQTRTYFEAGGGVLSDFDGLWERVVTRSNQRLAHAIREEKFAKAGGVLAYVISGRKP